MDLGAYVQMEDLGQIAKENGIEIPRLRGYRLMKDEEFISKEEIKEMKKRCAIEVVERLCESVPFWSSHPSYIMYSRYIKRLQNYYLIKDKDSGKYIDIRWDRIHGKKRKILKYAIKKKERAIQAQYDMWNKYVGQNGVLYIHSRMGGGNWKWYDNKDSIIKQPWFLGRVDDWWDNTYCDFYAKIKEAK